MPITSTNELLKRLRADPAPNHRNRGFRTEDVFGIESCPRELGKVYVILLRGDEKVHLTLRNVHVDKVVEVFNQIEKEPIA